MRWLAGLLAGVALVLPVRAADVPQVDVVLSLPGGRDHFDAGEPLPLDLAFVARAAGGRLREFAGGVVPGAGIEEIFVRAEDGGDGPWVYDRTRWLPPHNDYFLIPVRLPVGDAVRRPLDLNDWVRFERPGRYTLQLRTRRIQGQAAVLTNAVTVQIDLPSAADEATRARELAERIRTAANADDARRLAHELGWLGGDVAADLQLDLLLNRDGVNPHCVNVEEGLWWVRDRWRLVQRLERVIADPAQLLTAGDVLWQLTTLRFSLDGEAPPLYLERISAEALRFGYVQRVVQSLPQRSGDALVYAAVAVLDVAQPDGPEAAAARAVLQSHPTKPAPICSAAR